MDGGEFDKVHWDLVKYTRKKGKSFTHTFKIMGRWHPTNTKMGHVTRTLQCRDMCAKRRP